MLSLRQIRQRSTIGLILALSMTLLMTSTLVPTSSAITPGDVVGANAVIQSGFVSTYQAERNGGNATTLIAALNSAVQLVEKAQAENSTNPSQASSDIQAARQLAQNVISNSTAVSAAGSSLRQFVLVKAVILTATIFVAAALAYGYGGRVFRWLWVKVYGGFVVGPANG